MAPQNRKAPHQTRAEKLVFDLDALADQAEESKAGFLPILNFGKKTEPGEWLVTFDDSKPTLTEKEFDDEDGPHKRLVINANVSRVNLETGEAGPARPHAIMMRAEAHPKTGKLHSLTNGVLALYKTSGKDLKGVKGRITKRVYDHPQRGESCAYDVYAVDDS